MILRWFGPLSFTGLETGYYKCIENSLESTLKKFFSSLIKSILDLSHAQHGMKYCMAYVEEQLRDI